MATVEPIYIRSSSPALPSPSAFLHQVTPSPSIEAQEPPSPRATISGFTTAAVIHHAHLNKDQLPAQARQKDEKAGKLKSPKKAARVGRAPSSDAIKGSKANAARVAKSVISKKVVKRVRKKITKSASIILNSDETDEASAYFDGQGVAQTFNKAQQDPGVACQLDEPAERVPAPKRRRSWTPLKDTTTLDINDSAVFLQDETTTPARVPLSELIGNFQYAATDNTAKSQAESSEPTSKRQRISPEVSATIIAKPRKRAVKSRASENAPASRPVKKPKAPKKKAQTITALATAAYRSVVHPDTAQGTVSEFFVSEKPVAEEDRSAAKITAVEAVKSKKQRRSRAKDVIAYDDNGAKIKPTPKPKKPKVRFDEVKQAPELYSPERARHQIEKQKFLFGSSSQLAAEESPTFIREMQHAIRDSELVLGSQVATISPRKSYASVPTAPHGTNLSVNQAERELWCSAARDFKGGLLRDTSGLARGKATKLLNSPLTPLLTSGETSKEVTKDVVDVADEDMMEKRRIETEHVALTADCLDKDRDAVVDLCTASPASPAKSSVTVGVQSPSAPRGIDAVRRFAASPSSQQTKKSWQDIDDISDAEAPPTPSPPRRRASASPPTMKPLKFAIGSSPPPPALHLTAILKSSDLQWSEVSKKLFPRITTTIKACPRSTDPEKPSWFQKILLYDPIVVEDLADYLNLQGLRVPVRKLKRKDAPAKKKKGRPKKNAEPSEVAIEASESDSVILEEELQAWMVQKWCEEHSVCCVLRESLWGGSRKRY